LLPGRRRRDFGDGVRRDLRRPAGRATRGATALPQGLPDDRSGPHRWVTGRVGSWCRTTSPVGRTETCPEMPVRMDKGGSGTPGTIAACMRAPLQPELTAPKPPAGFSVRGATLDDVLEVLELI